MAFTGVGMTDKKKSSTAVIRTTQVPVVSGADDHHYPNHVSMSAPREHWTTNATSATDNSEHTLLANPDDGDFPIMYVESVQIGNSHASSIATIAIKDGTGGTTRATIIAPFATTIQVRFNPPLKISEGNDAVFQVATGVTTIYLNAQGFSSNV